MRLQNRFTQMDGGEYKSDFELTAERVVSAALVILWIVLSYRTFGLIIALRAAVFFTISLGCVWFPEFVSRLQHFRNRRHEGFIGPFAPILLKLFGWIMILGLPAAWILFSRVLGR